MSCKDIEIIPHCFTPNDNSLDAVTVNKYIKFRDVGKVFYYATADDPETAIDPSSYLGGGEFSIGECPLQDTKEAVPFQIVCVTQEGESLGNENINGSDYDNFSDIAGRDSLAQDISSQYGLPAGTVTAEITNVYMSSNGVYQSRLDDTGGERIIYRIAQGYCGMLQISHGGALIANSSDGFEDLTGGQWGFTGNLSAGAGVVDVSSGNVYQIDNNGANTIVTMRWLSDQRSEFIIRPFSNGAVSTFITNLEIFTKPVDIPVQEIKYDDGSRDLRLVSDNSLYIQRPTDIVKPLPCGSDSETPSTPASTTDVDVALTEVGGTGNVPAGLRSVTINNITGITTINGGFEIGDGRRVDAISYGTERGNGTNETLPAYTLSGGTWQWTGLQE